MSSSTCPSVVYQFRRRKSNGTRTATSRMIMVAASSSNLLWILSWPGNLRFLPNHHLHLFRKLLLWKNRSEDKSDGRDTLRGIHTLKKPQYQLCYVDPGIASEEEMENLKIVDSIFLEF